MTGNEERKSDDLMSGDIETRRTGYFRPGIYIGEEGARILEQHRAEERAAIREIIDRAKRDLNVIQSMINDIVHSGRLEADKEASPERVELIVTALCCFKRRYDPNDEIGLISYTRDYKDVAKESKTICGLAGISVTAAANKSISEVVMSRRAEQSQTPNTKYGHSAVTESYNVAASEEEIREWHMANSVTAGGSGCLAMGDNYFGGVGSGEGNVIIGRSSLPDNSAEKWGGTGTPNIAKP